MQISPNLKTKYWFSKNLYRKLPTLSLPLIIIIFLSSMTYAQTTELQFELINQSNGAKTYQLTISTTQTLYDYYQRQNHQIYENTDLAKFVTPSPLEPVAEDLWTIYDNTEDFANGVLMITHQIPYEGSAPQKYPIETLKENIGDCDLFSFLAASIMKAGGLDVVLLLFEQEEHMTVGVYLSESPTSARTSISYFTYEQKPYYIAETTGNYENGWRVGECPDLVKGSSAQIIPLNQIEQNPSPDQVFSSYSTPQYSSLLISASTEFAIAQNEIQIIGSLSPSLEGENITLYFSSYGSTLNQIATIKTDAMGRFLYNWDSPPGGIFSIRANWSGDSNYIGSDSVVSRIVIIPLEWVMMGGILALCLIILVIVILATRGISSSSGESFSEFETEEYNY